MGKFSHGDPQVPPALCTPMASTWRSPSQGTARLPGSSPGHFAKFNGSSCLLAAPGRCHSGRGHVSPSVGSGRARLDML